MSYVDTNLLPGETVVYRGRIHWIVMAPAIIAGSALDLLACVFLVGAFVWQGPKGAFSVPLAILAAMFAVAGSGWVTLWAVQRKATEIAVTSRRVLIKKGLLTRHTTEILLSKVESVSIEESPVGQTLGFGKVTIHGTGGTPEIFDRIADPNEFRRQIQGQIDASSSMGFQRSA
jgi:membrane protein YdbS with pleckstrin-like domain